jgi:hypothetical protein
MIYFNECFNLDESLLEEYGAFNISLINDLPVFIDPFLLYGSEKEEYSGLHESILNYLAFLRDKSTRGNITEVEIERWYKFSEVKQNWLGFSVSGNGGSGLGKQFGEAMSKSLHVILDDEHITDTSHLEKVTLFQLGVGKDNISDFTCNLIKNYLLEYTEGFAIKYLQTDQTRSCTVEKARFDYDIEKWMAKSYTLPIYNGDYIILTPRDLLTKDENWINSHDLRGDFTGICNSIPNNQLREDIYKFYKSQLPAPIYVGKGRKRRQKARTAKEIAIAVNGTINQFPSIIDYFIKQKEENAKGAMSIADEKVTEVETIFQANVKELVSLLKEKTEFYNKPAKSGYKEAIERVYFLKDVIENKDGYRLFYYKNAPIKKESDLQVIYRLTWYSSPFDLNREVNNGRGPADYTVSMGSADKTIVEFKLASNSKLKMNLENQTKIYEKASNANQSIKVILYFTDVEYQRTMAILKDLNMTDDENVVLIDACDNKLSASNVK